jgi:hypothetical protein
MNFFSRKPTTQALRNEVEVIHYVDSARALAENSLRRLEQVAFICAPHILKVMLDNVSLSLLEAIEYQKKVSVNEIKDANIIKTGFRADELKKDRYVINMSYAIVKNLEYLRARTGRITDNAHKLNPEMLKKSMESLVNLLERYTGELRRVYKYEQA